MARAILGIGNPGEEYRGTRHNVGWEVLDRIAERKRLSWREAWRTPVLAAGSARDLLLVKPLTYVNASGKVVPELIRRVTPEEVLVVCDDADLPLGRLRIRPKGSSGGHRGLESLIRGFGHGNFARMRIGIGRGAADLREHVLDRFLPEEEPVVRKAVERAVEAALVWASEGLHACMNRFNRPAGETSGGE